MATYTITNIIPQTDQETGEIKTDQYGNKRYKVFVKDESGQIYNFSKGYKGEPNKAGDTLNGTIEQKEGSYGKYQQFTADKPAFGGGGRTFSPRSPEEQDQIMRQHAVTDAISFFAMQGAVVAKATSDTTIIMQAERFLSYYKNGAKKVADIPAQNAPQHEEEPLPEYEEGEEDLTPFD